MRRKRRRHPQSSTERMRYGQASCMQVEPPRSGNAGQVARRFAVFEVAEDRRADRGAMGAQLVRASGDRHQSEPARLLSGAVDHLVISDGAATLLGVGTNAFAAAPRHLRERQVYAALPQLWYPD